jgi:hypothetical protein
MILKNLINLFNLSYVIMFILLLYILNNFLITSKIRSKFLLLLVIILIFSCIGFFYNLDGLVMLFLVSELSIILIFITMFSQLYTHNKENLKQNSFFFLLILIIINIIFYLYIFFFF